MRTPVHPESMTARSRALAGSTRDLVLGVDPGFTGALALYSLGHKGLETVKDMPIVTIREIKHVDGVAVATWVDSWQHRILFAVIEEVGARPLDGGQSAFRFGYGAGLLKGCIDSAYIPTHLIKPAVWKCQMGLSQNKRVSVERAQKEFPGAAGFFTQVKHDGRAEAALLALFGARRLAPLHGYKGDLK